MAGKKFRYELDLDAGDANRELERLGQAWEELGTEAKAATTGLDAALGQSNAAVNQLETTMRGMLGAFQAVKSQSDGTFTDEEILDYIGSLTRLGASLDEIEARGDEVYASLKRAGDVEMGRTVAGADQVATKLRAVKEGGDQSRSVLANLAGNAAQDLGELGGVVGSLGVGIGQLAEYAVDGNIALGNLAKVAGPMLALSAALAAVQFAQKNIGKEQRIIKENVAGLTETLDDSIGAFDDWKNSVTSAFEEGSASAEEFLSTAILDSPMFDAKRIGEVRAAMGAWGGNIGDLGQMFNQMAIYQGEATLGLDSWIRGQLEAKGIIGDQAEALADLIANGDQWSEIQGLITGGTTNLSEEQERQVRGLKEIVTLYQQLGGEEGFDKVATDILNANAAIEGHTELVNAARDATDNEVDALFKYLELLGNIRQLQGALTQIQEAKNEADAEAADRAAEYAQAVIDAAEALRELQASLREVGITFDEQASRADGFSAALDQMNEASQLDQAGTVIGFVDDMHAVGDALRDAADAGVDLNTVDLVPESWHDVMNMPEELGPVVDALSGFRDTMQTEMAAAFTEGGAPGVREWAADTAQAITDELHGAGVESDEQIHAILQSLGLLPEQISMTIGISGEEQARAMVDTLLGAIGELPPEVALKVAAELQDDPMAAIGTIVQFIESQGASVPVELLPVLDEMEEAITGVEDADHTVSFVTETPNLDDTSGAIDLATEDRTTQVIVPKSDSLGAMGTLIDEVTKPRTLDINAKSDNLGALNDLLNEVSAPRILELTINEIGNYDDTVDSLDALEDERVPEITIKEIDNYSETEDALDDLADQRNPQYKVEAPGAGALDRLLDVVARARTVNFITRSDNAGAMEGILNHVARPRNASIYADAHVGDAESQLNVVARDRTADIYVTTHQHTVTTSSGGGASATPGMAPAPALVGAAPMAAPGQLGPVAAPATATTVVERHTGPSHVTLQVGVIGNRFTLQRAVSKATRGAYRMNGKRL